MNSSPSIPEPQNLALNGGPKVRNTGNVVRRLFGPEEKEAVMALMDSAIDKGSHLMGYNGEQEEAYCKEFAEFMGGGFADGVNSGTNAVFVALRALDLEPYNHNMDEMGACIGRVQLKKLPARLNQRRAIAARVGEGCKDLAGVQLVMDPPRGKSAYWHMFFRFDSSAYRVPKEKFVEAVTAEGIGTVPGYGHYPCRMLWARNKSVFGTSGLPWSAVPEAPKPEDYPIPNAEAVDAAYRA